MHTERNIPYEKAEMRDIKGRKFELLYDGITNGALKLTYREYIDSTIQPAFYETVNYALNPNGTTTIQFKGLEIEILDTGNNKITYKVLKGLRSR
jgi:hypothetical protein